MSLIRPCADLRNNYTEISRICHKTKEPIYITKNGFNDLVVLSHEAFEKMSETNEEKIERLIAKKFDKHYSDFESFKTDFIERIKTASREIKDGKGISMESAVAELEAKYEKL